MSFWEDEVPAFIRTWLLEESDAEVRYLTLRDLQDLPADDSVLLRAKEAAHQHGLIAHILSHMDKTGFWIKPGAGYYPKYTGSVWSLIMLAQLGADLHMDERIARACNYLLDYSLTEDGQFTMNGAPSSTIDCLQGNLCAALLDLGCNDPRLEGAFAWMARTTTGQGLASKEERAAPLRYYAYQCGPGFACGANWGLPCAWGAVKIMLAFSKLPQEQYSPLVEQAIQCGVDFLFSVDPAGAQYPCEAGKLPSGNWWRFGFPLFYVTDLLQVVEVLVALGYGHDARLANAVQLIRGKQTAQGNWLLEYSYAGKTWVEIGEKKQPNPWVTLRALRVLKRLQDG